MNQPVKQLHKVADEKHQVQQIMALQIATMESLQQLEFHLDRLAAVAEAWCAREGIDPTPFQVVEAKSEDDDE